MKSNQKIYFVLILGFILFSFSCATTTYYQIGHKALNEERYNDAIRNFKLAIIDDIYNVEAIRDFGIAIYYKKKLNLAERFLRLSLIRRPNDPVIFYHLGLIYEDSGQFDKAIKMYSKYIDVSPFNSLRDQIEGRLYVLINRKIKAEVEVLLTQEKALDVISIPNNTIAVTNFINMTGQKELDILQKGLVDMLITDLSQIKLINVVERARLQLLMKEMALTQTGLLDEKMTPRMGQLLGAAHIINGSLLGFGGQDLQVNSSISHVKYGIESKPPKVIGSLREFVLLEKDLVFSIIGKFGIKLSEEERAAIERVPTKDILAFMAYCHALDYEDNGLFAQARVQYQQAITLDPAFIKARSGVLKMDALSSFDPIPPKPKTFEILAGKSRGKGGTQKRNVRNVSYNPGKSAKATLETRSVIKNRLYRSAERVNPGFVPSVESRKPTVDVGASSFGVSAPVKIRIPIPTNP